MPESQQNWRNYLKTLTFQLWVLVRTQPNNWINLNLIMMTHELMKIACSSNCWKTDSSLFGFYSIANSPCSFCYSLTLLNYEMANSIFWSSFDLPIGYFRAFRILYQDSWMGLCNISFLSVCASSLFNIKINIY